MEEKCYNFTIEINHIGKGYVYAKDIWEAKEKINEHDWNDIYDETDTEFGEILEIEEEL